MIGNPLENFLNTLYDVQKINTEFPLQYLICLSEIAKDEGLCLSQLAEKTGMPLSTVSRITSALSKDKGNRRYELIRIKIPPEEKRKKKLFLSDRGREVIACIAARIGS